MMDDREQASRICSKPEKLLLHDEILNTEALVFIFHRTLNVICNRKTRAKSLLVLLQNS